MRDAEGRKKEASKQGHTNNKAKRHNTPKAVILLKKNELHVHVHVHLGLVFGVIGGFITPAFSLSCLGSSVVERSVYSVECRGFESHFS